MFISTYQLHGTSVQEVYCLAQKTWTLGAKHTGVLQEMPVFPFCQGLKINANKTAITVLHAYTLIHQQQKQN